VTLSVTRDVRPLTSRWKLLISAFS